MAALLLLSHYASAHDNGAGLTPAMGYNTWNDFRCKGITADNVKKVTDKIVSTGLRELGYKYVNIDDCWAVSRDSQQKLVADKAAFPDGVKALADYVHSKGLKFGIYTDRGTLTCAGRPASLDHESIDAKTFAEWGVDYLKEDSCNASQDHNVAFAQYAKMRDALNATGRQVYFSLCGWNAWYAPKGWELGNSWRTTGDVNGWDSVWASITINSKLATYAKPGGWNDPDMLVGSSPAAAVHNTPDQSRTQFSLWAVMAAPLLIGSNILNITAYDLETYSNQEVIEVDQDAGGVQGTIIWENCPAADWEQLARWSRREPHTLAVPNCQQVWAKPLKDGSHAVAFVNYNATGAVDVTCDAKCLSAIGFSAQDKIAARDLWAHKDIGPFSGKLTAAVAKNGATALWRVKKA